MSTEKILVVEKSEESVSNGYRNEVYALIDSERERQKELGKPERMAWASWFMILADYFGRVGNSLWRLTFNGGTHEEILVPLVKVMAIGVAWMEDIVRFADYISLVEEEDGEQTEG